MFSAEFTIPDPRRRSTRTSVAIDTALDIIDFSKSLCRVTDLSAEGVRLSTYSALPSFGAIILTLPLIGERPARIIWANELEAGCAFETPLKSDEMEQLAERFSAHK